MSLRLTNLTVAYDGRPAVHHVSGEFLPGSMTAVVGPNGAGKSTLLRTIAGLRTPLEGRVEGAAHVALLPQASQLDRSFPISALDVVLFGLWAGHGAFRAVPPAGRDAARAALEAVGLRGFEARGVGSLSAGQFQRLLFARLLVQDAPILLLDEPFTALDERTATDMLTLLRRWHGEGRTIIAVLHDLELVRREFPRTLLLARDCVAWDATETALTAANRLRARHMAEHWAADAERCDRAA
ncbi:MAG: metal ABC transporter ATP-binding protein [Alphaproteobacteria bacterium]|nr:metal ABC transporter ATP-binding protein [Alphaproteobacteria bacterium]